MIFFVYLRILLLFVLISVLGKIGIYFLLPANEQLPPTELLLTLLKGLQFDFSIAALPALITGLLIFFFPQRKFFVYTLLILFATLHINTTAADVMYFQHVGRHLTYEYTTLFKNFTDLLVTGWSEHFLLFVFSFFAWLLIAFLCKKIIGSIKNKHKTSAKQKLLTVFFLLLISILIFRGGFQHAPLKPQHFYKVTDSRSMVVLWNPSYYIFHSLFFKNKSTKLELASPQEVLAMWNKNYSWRANKETPPHLKPNIIFILFESLSGEFAMDSIASARDVTPELHKLTQKSLSTIATVAGGLRTSEGIYSTFCSQQNPIGSSVADGTLTFFEYDCLPHYLNRNGWSSAFIQGTLSETSNVGPFAQKVGFKESYGKYQYKNKLYGTNSWGYYDQDIYAFALEQMEKMPQPFLIGINTNSTHSPDLPDGVTPVFGSDPFANRAKSVIHFADEALGEFIQAFSKKSYAKDTLIVVLSDHGGHLDTMNDVNRFMIPSMIYWPDHIKAEKKNFVSSQRDLAPTVLEIIGGYLPALAGTSWLSKHPYRRPPEFHFNSKIGAVTNDKAIVYDELAKIQQCFQFLPPTFPPTECGKEDLSTIESARAFTQWSQELLLSGKTKDILVSPSQN